MNRPSRLSLMQLQIETLFVSDRSGRLMYINEPWNSVDNPAPLVFIGRTDEGSLCRFRHDIPLELQNDVEQIVWDSKINLVDKQPALVSTLKRRTEISGLRVGSVWSGPAYCFAKEPPKVSGCVVINPSRVGLLCKHFDDIDPEVGANSPCVAAVVDGDAVSVCRTVRRSLRAAEAGVSTAVGYRRRGIATQVVNNWASIVIESGLIPLYSTSWDNVASRRLAEKLGLVLYGTDLNLFEYQQ